MNELVTLVESATDLVDAVLLVFPQQLLDLLDETLIDLHNWIFQPVLVYSLQKRAKLHFCLPLIGRYGLYLLFAIWWILGLNAIFKLLYLVDEGLVMLNTVLKWRVGV